MSVSGVGGAMSVDRVMQLRAQILERNQALARAGTTDAASAPQAVKPSSFADTLDSALKQVNEGQNQAAKLSESYERGGTDQRDHQRHRQRAADRGLREHAADLEQRVGEPFGRAHRGGDQGCAHDIIPACS